MIILRRNNFSASIPGQLKKIQKLEGIYAMNINQGHNPLSKEMSDLAYKIARENDVYRQKFRKKIGTNRDIENFIIDQCRQKKKDWLENPIIKETSKLIDSKEQKLKQKGHVISKNILSESDKNSLITSLNSKSFRSDSNFIAKAGEFDHFYKKDAKKISSESKKQMLENSFYFRGTPEELVNPNYYRKLGFNKEVSNHFSSKVPNPYSDSLYTIQTNGNTLAFHNKLHKFDQAILDSHEIGHFLSPNGHHPQHMIKEKAANDKALAMARDARISTESENKVKKLHKLQLRTNNITKNQENYAYFNFGDRINKCNYIPRYE